MRPPAPATRIRIVRDVPIDEAGRFVVYLMNHLHRRTWNFGLQQAAWYAERLRRPLLIIDQPCLAALGTEARHRDFARAGQRVLDAGEWPPGVIYVANDAATVDAFCGAHRRLRDCTVGACVVVLDDPPWDPTRASADRLATHIRCRVEAIDGHGLLPTRGHDRVFSTAAAFRRHLWRELPAHLQRDGWPLEDPLAGIALPRPTGPLGPQSGWPPPSHDSAETPLAEMRGSTGGPVAARARWLEFLHGRLASYDVDRNHPDAEGSSGLSPYLRWGHIGPHEMLSDVCRLLDWTRDDPALRAPKTFGPWWGAPPAIAAFLDELVTWRELAANFAALRPDVDRYEALPPWAREVLSGHAADARPHRYDPTRLEAAQTHDRLWNAAQTELLQTGRMHGYLRMLWGKNIIGWSATPGEAFDTMHRLNDRYALDGGDPNSAAGIAWCFGRYDRPWGPRRPVFGTIRYMSSESARRKLRLRNYLSQFGGDL